MPRSRAVQPVSHCGTGDDEQELVKKWRKRIRTRFDAAAAVTSETKTGGEGIRDQQVKTRDVNAMRKRRLFNVNGLHFRTNCIT